MSSIVRFEQVSVTVHTKQVLSNINFELFSGQKGAIHGQSGAGKSSILKTILGLLPITGGAVYFEEQPLTLAWVQHIRRATAYISQEPLLGADSVRGALMLPFQFAAHRRQRPTEAQLQAVLERMQLPAAILEQDSNRISGGEKQRLALARGLLLNKQVYLLDEVTSALDADNKRAVLAIFNDPKLTVLAVTHDPEWLQCCDLTLELASGQLTQVKLHAHP